MFGRVFWFIFAQTKTKNMKQLLQIFHYSDLGYSIEFTKQYGRDFVRMTKRHSYVRETPIYCEQQIEHEALKDANYFDEVIKFMYNDIRKQEETGNYYEKL